MEKTLENEGVAMTNDVWEVGQVGQKALHEGITVEKMNAGRQQEK